MIDKDLLQQKIAAAIREEASRHPGDDDDETGPCYELDEETCMDRHIHEASATNGVIETVYAPVDPFAGTVADIVLSILAESDATSPGFMCGNGIIDRLAVDPLITDFEVQR